MLMMKEKKITRKPTFSEALVPLLGMVLLFFELTKFFVQFFSKKYQTMLYFISLKALIIHSKKRCNAFFLCFCCIYG